MISFQVLPLWTGSRSLARAFEWRGVTLKFPSFSRSGVRGDDGMVVFAMAKALVRVNDWGCSCPLWFPAGAHRATGRPSGLERLQHCRLAVAHGAAEGFLLNANDAPATASEVLSLQVVKAGNEYWATWGAAVRAHLSEQPHNSFRAYA